MQLSPRPTSGFRWGLLAVLASFLLPSSVLAQASDAARADGLQRFESERLLLLDHRGKAIGPAELGFAEDDFGIFNSERFHVVHAGELRYRLSFEDFMRLTQDNELQDRWDEAQLVVRRQQAGSIGLLIVGGALAAGGLIMGSLAYANGQDALVFALPLFFGTSTGFFIGGGALAGSAKFKSKELASPNLEVLADRNEAWSASGNYNDALWRALSLDEKPATSLDEEASEQPSTEEAEEEGAP